jgi:guanylate kinase
MTTRDPRPGEINGKDYFFVTRERFDEALRNNELLEHADFVDHSYGTPKAYVDNLIMQGHNVLLEIETSGAEQVMNFYNSVNEDYVSIFLICQDLVELEKRIRGRKTEDEDSIHKRIEKAKRELELKANYQYVVLNDDRERAAKEIADIIKTEQSKNK